MALSLLKGTIIKLSRLYSVLDLRYQVELKKNQTVQGFSNQILVHLDKVDILACIIWMHMSNKQTWCVTQVRPSSTLLK